MQDDMRADVLYRALSGDEPVPAELDDELGALLTIGTELQLHGATIAMIEEADTRFDPAFIRQLRAKLIAEHPAAAAPVAAVTQAAPLRAMTEVSRRSRLIWRRVAVGATLVLALIVAGVIAVTQHSTQPSLVGVAASTATALPPRPYGVQTTKHLASATNGGVAVPRRTVKSVATPTTNAAIMQSSANKSAKTLTPTPKMQALAPSKAAPPRTYLLPSSLPNLPGSAVTYAVRANSLTKAESAKIVASFPGMSASGRPGQYRSTRGDSMSVNPQDGDIVYTSGVPAAVRSASVPAASARKLAISWLTGHFLGPRDLKLMQAKLSTSDGVTTVRFNPALRFPLDDGQTLGELVVRLAPDGHVTFARREWPVLTPIDTVQLVAPGVAAARTTAPATAATEGLSATVLGVSGAVRPVRVDTVALVYVVAGSGASRSLLPYYRFVEHVTGATGPSHDVAYLVPASAAP